jgi:hypothetical protein
MEEALHSIERDCIDVSIRRTADAQRVCNEYVPKLRDDLQSIARLSSGNEEEALSLAGQLDAEAATARSALELRLRLVVSVTVLLILSLGTFWYWRRWNDGHGRRQLVKIADFEELLEFVARNHYSLTLNEHAVATIQTMAPVEAKSLRLISDAAEVRLGRIGDVNERIGNMLLGVANGIDNILNRR